MVLSLPPETPSRSVLYTVVFGVVVVSILLQASLFPPFSDWLMSSETMMALNIQHQD